MVKIARPNLMSLLLLTAVGVIAILLILALLGPSVGNIFSTTVNSIGGYAPQASLEGQGGGAITTGYDPADSVSTQERIIIRNATLRIVVSDTEAKLNEIAALAEEFGGWVVNSNINRVTTASGVEAVRGSITVRVMAERLDEALTRIKSSAISVESEAISGQDVTQQYVDLTSRLNNLQAAETQLQSIMDDARRTEDVLSVYNELVRVRGEIETLQGQIQYYSESAAFSSISVELIPQALETPIQIAGWSPEGTARSAFLALLNVLRFIVDVAITLVVLVLPLVLIFGVPGWLVYRRARRNRQRGLAQADNAH